MDRLNSLARSDFGRLVFFEGMKAAGLINDAEIEQLKQDKDALMESEWYKYMMSKSLVDPAMSMLRKLAKKTDSSGKPLYDPANPQSQLSPEQAQEIINKLKARWNGMNDVRKANDATRAMERNYEFLTRDADIMG